jgi:HK97 family phage prohead protease
MPDQKIFCRSVPLDGISIRSGGDGRTVEAYAAVFNTSVRIKDYQGVYDEQISPRAFAKTLSDRGLRFGVFYNHASTVDGTPSESASVPLGSPVEIRADEKGLLTVVRYNATSLADQILETIRNGDITGMSFSGRFVASSPEPGPWGYAPNENGEFPQVTRNEIALREFGPTPFPAYESAQIVGTRSLSDLLDQASPSDLDRLRSALDLATLGPTGSGPTSDEAGSDEPLLSGITPGRRAALARVIRSDHAHPA